MTLVHPTGYASKLDNKGLNISFDPSPDYAGIAKAAAGGNAWAATVCSVGELAKLLPEAVAQVRKGIPAILDVRLQGSWVEGESVAGRNRLNGHWA